MLAVTTRKQIVVYAPDELYADLQEMKATDPRLSISAIGEKAIRIALPALREEFGPPQGPTHEGHRRKTRAA